MYIHCTGTCTHIVLWFWSTKLHYLICTLVSAHRHSERLPSQICLTGDNAGKTFHTHDCTHQIMYTHTHTHTHIVRTYPNLAVCTGDHVCTNVYTHHTLYCVQTWMHTQVVHSSCLYVCYGARKVRAQHLSGLLIKSACQRLRLVAKRGKKWGLKAGQPHLASYMVWDKGWPTRRGTIINVV